MVNPSISFLSWLGDHSIICNHSRKFLVGEGITKTRVSAGFLAINDGGTFKLGLGIQIDSPFEPIISGLAKY